MSELFSTVVLDVNKYFSDVSLRGIFFLLKKAMPVQKMIIGKQFKTRKSTVGLIVPEPRTLVKSALCLANCAGTPHSGGVCDVGLCWISALWYRFCEHRTVRAGYQVCERHTGIPNIFVKILFTYFYHSYFSFYSAFT